MTAIVGLVDTDGTVWMGGDSAALSGWDLQLLAGGKVFRNGPCLLGSTGPLRLANLLQYGLVPPPIPADPADLPRYLATTFVDAVRECFTAAGFTKKDNEREGTEGAFLLGLAGRLVTISSDFAVSEDSRPYAACGRGESFALGVLWATEGQPAADRILQALRAAEAFSAGVRGPFTVYGLDPAAVV